MKYNLWLWRGIWTLVTATIFLGVSLFTLERLEPYFAAQILSESDGSLLKSSWRYAVQEISPELVLLTVAVEVSPEDGVSARDLFIRVTVYNRVFEDNQRVNDYPFLQITLKKGSPVFVELIHRRAGQEIVYHRDSIDLQTAGVFEGTVLRGAAETALTEGALQPSVDLLPIEESAVPIDAVDIRWIGSASTLVLAPEEQVIDLSQQGKFQTSLEIQSAIDQKIKVVASLIDDRLTVSHTIAPQGKGNLFFNVDRFAYGPHRLQVVVLLPDGKKTAEVVIPFEYINPKAAAEERDLFQYWQWFGIGLLFLLGITYGILKLSLRRFHKNSE